MEIIGLDRRRAALGEVGGGGCLLCNWLKRSHEVHETRLSTATTDEADTPVEDFFKPE